MAPIPPDDDAADEKTTQRRWVRPCWPEDRLEGGGSGRPPSMSGYSRAGIAAEAGLVTDSISVAVREGRLDDADPYDVIRWIMRQRITELRADGLPVDEAITVLGAMSERSKARRAA